MLLSWWCPIKKNYKLLFSPDLLKDIPFFQSTLFDIFTILKSNIANPRLYPCIYTYMNLSYTCYSGKIKKNSKPQITNLTKNVCFLVKPRWRPPEGLIPMDCSWHWPFREYRCLQTLVSRCGGGEDQPSQRKLYPGVFVKGPAYKQPLLFYAKLWLMLVSPQKQSYRNAVFFHLCNDCCDNT